MYCVVDSVDSQFWGPYTKLPLAEKVLKFVQQAVDPDARVEFEECDPYEKEIKAGLIPVKVTIEIVGGTPKEPTVDLTWPPEKQEGLTINLPGYREYFVWCKNRTEAILKITRIKVPPPEQEPQQVQASQEDQDPLEELMEA
jgi:hypothetical protein